MIEPRLKKALQSEHPLDELRDVVRDLVAHGRSRESVVADFQQLRSYLQAQGRDQDEDVVLEAMDFVEGWCSPHMKI